MPQNQAAFITGKSVKPLLVRDAPYHPPSPNEVVIKNHAVAINPVDWKQQDYSFFIESYPSVFGCDVAGTVEAVGRSVTTFKPGDRVIAQTEILSLGPKYAAFQNYVPCPGTVVSRIPDSLSFTQGCVLPLSVNNTAMALFTQDNLNLPPPSTDSAPSNQAVFIYAGSTSVGSSAIPLAKAAGAFVAATAGKANHDYCTALGADHVLDYKSADWIEQAVAVLKDKDFAGVFDTISEPSTLKMVSELAARLPRDPHISSVGSPAEDAKAKVVFGTAIVFDERLARAVWWDYLPCALARGSLVAKPDAIVAGKGLESIQAAMETQRGGVSARKVGVEIL